MCLLNLLLKKQRQWTILQRSINFSYNKFHINNFAEQKYLKERCIWNKSLRINDIYHRWLITPFRRIQLNNYCSTGIAEKFLDNKSQDRDEFYNIKQIFPNPKETLNIISSRRGDKMFDVSFEESIGWTCTYSFIWPEVIQFKNISKSKREASDEAAAQALQWLYNNQHVNRNLFGNKSQDKMDINRIKQIFPTPKATLNIIRSRRGDKMFDVSFEESIGWTCTYSFVWPEVKQFKNTGKSKQIAGDTAAAEGLQWLYDTKRIDRRARLVYDKQVVQDMENNMNNMSVEISDELMEEINKIWDIYTSHTKNIYKKSSVRNEISNGNEDATKRGPRTNPVYGDTRNALVSESRRELEEEQLKCMFDEFDANHKTLPIDGYFQEIISTIEKSRVTLVIGEPGCGKSTRVPAAVLRRYGTGTAAVVTQPRRVAAISIAQRVAEELGQNVGDNIGYQVRLDAVLPQFSGGVLYCTSGIFLNKLVDNPGLEGCTHVVLDEAHERDVNTDLALLLLQRALELNPQLKLIIMSATLDIDIFTRYFENCPVIRVPGRAFPVDIIHLEDIPSKLNLSLLDTVDHVGSEHNDRPKIFSDEIVRVIRAVDQSQPDGAILVFLPGWSDIQMIKQKLEALDTYKSNLIIPMHSRLSNMDQARIFSLPPAGVRKVILSTNIAETSISVPDVVYVVDTGAHKEKSLQRDGHSVGIDTVWVSMAQAKQRAGRAGRLRPGVCYRLYTKKKEAELNDYTNATILSIPLEELVLKCKSYSPGETAQQFMSRLPEPPTARAVTSAVHDLMDIGALTASEELTPLGSMLTGLGTHPRLGIGLLHAAVVGALDAAANVAAYCSDGGESFFDDYYKNEEVRKIKSEFSKMSDHVAFHRIQRKYEETRDQNHLSKHWCREHGLSRMKLNLNKNLSNLYTRETLHKVPVDAVSNPEAVNLYSDSEVMTVALLLSGFNRLMISRKNLRRLNKRRAKLLTSTGKLAHISSSSVNYKVERERPHTVLLTYFSGLRSEERRALLISTTSVVSPLAALLFCMSDVKTVDDSTRLADTEAHTISDHLKNDSAVLRLTKHNLEFKMSSSEAQVIIKARKMIWDTLKYYIEMNQYRCNSEEINVVTSFKTELFETIKKLLEAQKDYIYEVDGSQKSRSHLIPQDVQNLRLPEQTSNSQNDYINSVDCNETPSTVEPNSNTTLPERSSEAQKDFGDKIDSSQTCKTFNIPRVTRRASPKQKWWEE